MKNIGVLESSVFHFINKASLDLFSYFDGLLAKNKFNINTFEWLLLAHVSKQPGESQKWYGENLLRDKTYMMRLIDSLERKKYVKRIPDKTDRRQNLLYATEAGDVLIGKTLPVLDMEYRSFFSDIDGTHIDITISVLKKLIQKMDAKRGEG